MIWTEVDVPGKDIDTFEMEATQSANGLGKRLWMISAIGCLKGWGFMGGLGVAPLEENRLRNSP